MIKSLRILPQEEKKDGTKMPIIEVICEGNGRRNKGYLSPFRGYKFQVSGTVDGQGDYGSSQVLGLGNLVRSIEAQSPIGKEATSLYASNNNVLVGVLEEMATLALFRFDNQVRYLDYDQALVLEKFIYETVSWVKGLIHEAKLAEIRRQQTEADYQMLKDIVIDTTELEKMEEAKARFFKNRETRHQTLVEALESLDKTINETGVEHLEFQKQMSEQDKQFSETRKHSEQLSKELDDLLKSL